MFIRANELSRALNVSKCTLWRWARAGEMPKPIKLSKNGVSGWLEADISKWLEERRQAATENTAQ
jgi:prophage regulatory protein